MEQYPNSGWEHPLSIFSTYFPPGWDLERLRGASRDELDALSDEEFDRMREGILSACPWGVDCPMPANAQPDIPNNQPIDLEPAGASLHFAVYRTTYDSTVEWDDFRRKFSEVVGHFNTTTQTPLAFRIIEDQTLENLTTEGVISKFETSNLPSTFTVFGICILVDKACIESFSRVETPSLIGTGPQCAQARTPFVKLVYRGYADDEESPPEQPGVALPARTFKIAYFAFWEELSTLLVSGYRPANIGGGLSENEAWAGAGVAFELEQ